MMRPRMVSGFKRRSSGRDRLPASRRLTPTALRSGVTLVEVMVVIGLISVITAGLFSLFIGALSTYDTGSGKSLSDTAASLALQKAAREIADGKTASVSSGVLTVQMPGVNNQGSYERGMNGDQVKLYLSGGKLYKQVNTSTATVLMKDVATASFTVSNNMVTLAITGQGQTGKKVSQTQITQVVALRNVESS